MAATVVIPARYGSTRFPAKILANQTGRPLVQHVVEQAKKCRRVRQVLVATDDARIAAALEPFGTRCVMTSPSHQSGTDRIAEVARSLEDEIIVNVQGDEPEIEPEIVDALIERLEEKPSSQPPPGVPGEGVRETDLRAAEGVVRGAHPTCAEGVVRGAHRTARGEEGVRYDMATAATVFPESSDPNDPNLVKVVMGLEGQAVYFSRCPIPYRRDPTGGSNAAYYLHLGIYAYRRDFLLRFASWPPTPLETTEKLEQLRALEHGASIFVLKVSRATHGIDTPQQYAEFVKRYKGVGSC